MTLNKFIELATKKIKDRPYVGEFELLVEHEGYVYETIDSLSLVNAEEGIIVEGSPTVACIRTAF